MERGQRRATIFSLPLAPGDTNGRMRLLGRPGMQRSCPIHTLPAMMTQACCSIPPAATPQAWGLSTQCSGLPPWAATGERSERLAQEDWEGPPAGAATGAMLQVCKLCLKPAGPAAMLQRLYMLCLRPAGAAAAAARAPFRVRPRPARQQLQPRQRVWLRPAGAGAAAARAGAGPAAAARPP